MSTKTVTTEQNDRIQSNAKRAVAQWTAALATAREKGYTDQIAAIEQTLDFWTRTATRNHVGRTIRAL